MPGIPKDTLTTPSGNRCAPLCANILRVYLYQADEELLLLEGIDMFGLGNWTAVAEHVGTKGQEGCRDHYYSVYIDSPAFPEPAPLPSMANVNQLQVCETTLSPAACTSGYC
jgi:hypothetical protein